MSGKTTTAIAAATSAACAFGLSALVFTGGSDVPSARTDSALAVPSATAPADADATSTVPTTAVDASVKSTATARHAKPTTGAETKKKSDSAPKHAKPTAGSKGLTTDAEGDGKILDDIGAMLAPSLPHVPDAYLPFPDDANAAGIEAGTTDESVGTDFDPSDPNAWGDPVYDADPGIVCSAELAERLGVPLSDSCASDATASTEPADTWDAEPALSLF